MFTSFSLSLYIRKLFLILQKKLMDKIINYKYGSAMDNVSIEIKITSDHEYKLLNGIEYILLNTLNVIHDLRLKTNEDELRKMSEKQSENYTE